jgi:hypothetical protein
MLQAYQEQHVTVEPSFRWIKNPAAISPVWLEKPERIAALAMLTVVGLLVYAVIQRQVRLYLYDHDQHVPGNKGPTATPTTAVVFALFTPVCWSNLLWMMRAASSSMVSKTIICSSVRPWALIRPGIKEGQRGKIRCRVPHPLERGI